jgi:hypothetical protein
MKKYTPYVIVLVLLGLLAYLFLNKKPVNQEVKTLIGINVDSLTTIIAEQKSQIIKMDKLTKADSLVIAQLKTKLKLLNIKPKELESKIDFILLTSDSGKTLVENHTEFILLDSGFLDSNVTQHFTDTTKHLVLNGEIDKGILSYKYQYTGTYELLLQKTRKNVFTPYTYKALLLSDDKNAKASVESVKFLNPNKFTVGLIGNITTDNYRPQFGIYGEYTKNGFIFGLNNTYFLNNKKVIPVIGLTVKKQLLEF